MEIGEKRWKLDVKRVCIEKHNRDSRLRSFVTRSQYLLHCALEKLLGWFENIDVRCLKIRIFIKNHIYIILVVIDDLDLPEIESKHSRTYKDE